MSINCSSDNANSTQIITQTIDDVKKFEYLLEEGVLGKISIFTADGKLDHEVVLKDGKIESLTTYHKDSGEEGCVIKPDASGVLGLIKLSYPDGTTQYEGSIIDNKRIGYGTEYFENGNKQYEGTWTNDLKNGSGVLFHPDGKIKYDGSWLSDKYRGDGKQYNDKEVLIMQGKYGSEKFDGTEYNDEGEKVYFGEMKTHNDKWIKHGQGKSFHKNGNINFYGNWLNDKKDSDGSLYFPDGKLKYKGYFRNGKYNGYGEKYDKSGKLQAKGHWKDRKLVDMYIPFI